MILLCVFDILILITIKPVTLILKTSVFPAANLALGVQMSDFLIDFNNTPFLGTSSVGAKANRLNWRCEMLLAKNRSAIQDKRVLDLASHDGRFSYACLQLGAKYVAGIEGRPHLVEHAHENLLKLGFSPHQFDFICGDIFSHLTNYKPGDFDTILCAGFFYHTIKQIELLRLLKLLHPQYIILDSTVYRENVIIELARIIEKVFFKIKKNMGVKLMNMRFFSHEYFVFINESHKRDGATIDPFDVAAVPTKSLIELLLKMNEFRFDEIIWNKSDISNWSNIDDYKRGRRVSYFISPY